MTPIGRDNSIIFLVGVFVITDLIDILKGGAGEIQTCPDRITRKAFVLFDAGEAVIPP